MQNEAAAATKARAAPSVDPDEHDDDAHENSSAQRRRSRQRQDYLLVSEQDDYSSSPPSRRITGCSRDKPLPTTAPLLGSSTDSSHKHHQQEQRGTPQLYHTATLIVLTLLLTVATHRYTFLSLRYKLNYFGTYQMRGVPTFHHDRPSRSSAPHHVLDGADSSVDSSGSANNIHPQDEPLSASPEVPLMIPREFTNRRGDTYSIPRGVPLPPPLLALMDVKLCGAALNAGDCRRVGGDCGDGTSNISGNSSSSLECSWCPNEAGSCIPKDMWGVMCDS